MITGNKYPFPAIKELLTAMLFLVLCNSRVYTQKSSTLSNNNIFSIFENREKNIWVGTRNGLNLMFGGDTIKIIQFYHSNTNPQTLADNYVRTIFQDKESDIWVGTYNGPGYLQKEGCKPEKKTVGTSL